MVNVYALLNSMANLILNFIQFDLYSTYFNGHCDKAALQYDFPFTPQFYIPMTVIS